MKYELEFTKEFLKKLKSLKKHNQLLFEKVTSSLQGIASNPFSPGLKSHKTNTRRHGRKWSSWVSGDLRIIWDFADEKLLIYVLTLGGHSGKNAVYK